MMRALVLALFALAVVAGAAFQLAVVETWHKPAGDGLQYYALSQELRAHRRFAYGPGQPPAYSRLPGYPLFLSEAAVREAPLPLEKHLVRATTWNVALDVGTATLAFLVLWEAGAASLLALAAGVALLVCPLLVAVACYGLTESLATFLATATLYFVFRAARNQPVASMALAGFAAGAGQLVRADALALVPAVLAAAVLLHRSKWRVRVGALVAFAACAGVVFAPWAVRNVRVFGEAHPYATEWLDAYGAPLRTGPIAWMRTWCSGSRGDGYINMLLVNHVPLGRAHRLLDEQHIVDDAAEKKRVLALFDHVDARGIDPVADAGFRALAAERLRRAPWRTLVSLPWARTKQLWSPLEEWELPVAVKWLELPGPRREKWFVKYDHYLYGAALLGTLVLLALAVRRREARFAVAVLGAAVVARSLLHAYAVPFPTQRYLVEAFPPLVLVAAFGLDGVYQLSRRGRRYLASTTTE